MTNARNGWGVTWNRSLVAAAVAVSPLLSACGSDQKADDPVREARSGLNQGAEIAIVLPAGAVLGQTALAANNGLTVADGVQIPANAGLGAIDNLGSSVTDIGADATVGAIRSVGNVSLRSRATVVGSLDTAGTVIQQTGVTVTGATHTNAVLTPNLRFAWRPPVLAGGPDIALEPAQQRTAAPGDYGVLNVKTGSTVSLSSGTYTFSGGSSIEPGATLKIDARAGSVIVYIGSSFVFKGALAITGDSSNVLFVALGTSSVDVLGSFQGSIFAPNAPLHLGTTDSGHTGSFFGKSVQVDARTKITTRPFAHWELLISPVPTVRCVSRFDDTHWSALFGYTNPLPVAINVPAGADNSLSGATGGSPTTVFAPGDHPLAFSVPFAGGSVAWNLRGTTVTASPSTPRCTENEYTPPLASGPRTPGIVEPDPPGPVSAAALAAWHPDSLAGNITLVQWPTEALLSPLPLSNFTPSSVTMPRSALDSFHASPTAQPDVIALNDEDVGVITFIDLNYVPELCATFRASYVDSGGPGAEDFGAQKGEQQLPAAFARASLSIGGTERWNGVLDSNGCVPTSGLGAATTSSLLIVPDGTPIVLNVESRFVAGAMKDVFWEVFFATDGLTQNAPASDFDAAGHVDLSKLKAGTIKFPMNIDTSTWGTMQGGTGGPTPVTLRVPPQHTSVTTDTEDDVTRVSAVVAQMLRQPDMGMVAGKFQAVANDGCPNLNLKTDSCFSPSNNILFIGPGNGNAARDSAWKYVIAHESGHFVQQLAMGSLDPTYSFCPTDKPNCNLKDPAQALNDPPDTPALCKCDHVTVANQLHCLQSLERSQDAQLEGWAQFYASKTWNNPDESSCTFQYYKEFLDLSCPPGAQCSSKTGGVSIFPPLARTCKDVVKWRNRKCAVQDFGTEFDWMGFLWNANTSSDQKATMDDLFAAYRQACGNAACGSGSAVDWAKFSAGASAALGPTSAKFTHLATTGDAFGVSQVTAP